MYVQIALDQERVVKVVNKVFEVLYDSEAQDACVGAIEALVPVHHTACLQHEGGVHDSRAHGGVLF